VNPTWGIATVPLTQHAIFQEAKMKTKTNRVNFNTLAKTHWLRTVDEESEEGAKPFGKINVLK
jgi:hypothetical protein